MTVLDAYAVVAYLRDEFAADAVGTLLAAGQNRVSAVNLAEAVDRLLRLSGRQSAEIIESVAWLEKGGMEIVPVNGAIGFAAGLLRGRIYDRRERSLSLADCVALATAAELQDALATADPALLAAARTEGIRSVTLPDSQGRVPS